MRQFFSSAGGYGASDHARAFRDNLRCLDGLGQATLKATGVMTFEEFEKPLIALRDSQVVQGAALGRLEVLVERNAEAIARNAETIARNSEAIEKLGDGFITLQAAMEGLTKIVDRNSEAINKLDEGFATLQDGFVTLQAAIKGLTETVDRFIN